MNSFFSTPPSTNGSAADALFGDGRQLLGIVVGGSLSKGLDVRLDAGVSIETVKVGQYMTVDGAQTRFFCVVSDLRLEESDQGLTAMPPDLSNPLMAEVLQGTGTYGIAHLVPTLIYSSTLGNQPVRTVPPHFAKAYEATQEELELIFGGEDAQHLWIGSPLDMEHTLIRLELPKLVERSSGVFGKSGTGKTYLTRILMAGILQKRAGVQLIFDMHNEYGWQGTTEGPWGHVKGLKQLFGSQVAVFTLDEASSRQRQVPVDAVLEIGYSDLGPDDIKTSAEALNLNDLQADAAERLARRMGGSWLEEFMDLDGKEAMKDLADSLSENESNLSALHRRLQSLRRLDFVKPHARENAVQLILDYLERGKTVVLEFGRYRNNALAQVLVANLLSRRIYDRWSERVEKALGDKSLEPPQLVITLEEAHKFLNPRMSGQTIFGTIAREMRKYNVTLLVVDQRPSMIDTEVLSQIGTKISCLLEDENDVKAVLEGQSGTSELRGVLSRLESKQQALIFGHAVPMPVVIRTRDYGSPQSYTDFGYREPAEVADDDRKSLFGP